MILKIKTEGGNFASYYPKLEYNDFHQDFDATFILEGYYEDDTAFSYTIKDMFVARFSLTNEESYLIAISNKALVKRPISKRYFDRNTHRYYIVFRQEVATIGMKQSLETLRKVGVIRIAETDLPKHFIERFDDIKSFTIK